MAANFHQAQAGLLPHIKLPPPPTPHVVKHLVRTVKDALNLGSNALCQGPHALGPQPSFVDDTAVGDIPSQILQAINASTLSAYAMFQFPGSDRHPSCINELKYEFDVSWHMIFLGYRINTRTMSVTWPEDKRQCLATMLDEAWLTKVKGTYMPPVHPRTASQILGLVRNGAMCSPYGLYLSTRLQFDLNDTVSAAPRAVNPDAPANLAHHKHIKCSWWKSHWISIHMMALRDLKLLRATLVGPGSEKMWTRAIGLLIPRAPTGEPIGDASFEGMGGYCIHYRYMW